MMRTLALIFAFLVCLPAHATLVAVVPSRDGLVVAADSRFTFLGAPCDGAFKIFAPRRPLRTVAVVTGDSIFVEPPRAGEDPCRYLEAAPRLLDMGAVITAYFDRGGDDPAQISLRALAADCVQAVDRFQEKYPAALRGYRGRELASVVVASYDPVRRVSMVRNFVVRINARSGRAEAARMSTIILGANSPSGVWMYGETDFVNRYVYNGPGRRFLSPATLALLRGRAPVGEVQAQRAETIAANVIQAASRSAEIDPPASGIGGATRLVFVGSAPRPQSLQWPASLNK